MRKDNYKMPSVKVRPLRNHATLLAGSVNGSDGGDVNIPGGNKDNEGTQDPNAKSFPDHFTSVWDK